MASANRPGQGLLVIERILRDRDGIWVQINEERDLGPLTRQMLITSVVSLAIYGTVLGASNSAAQALSSFVKLPLLFLATLAICLPTLYLFNLVFGARLSVMQAVTLIMVCITVISVLTLAFAPISLFFLISAHSYAFFKLLNVSILVLTALVGLRFLTNGMRALNEYQANEGEAATAEAPPAPLVPPAPPVMPAPEPVPAGTFAAVDTNGARSGAQAPIPMPVAMPVAMPGQMPVAMPGQMPIGQPLGVPIPMPVRVMAPLPAKRPASMMLLYIWILLFGFVGTQLAWTLRPFFGDPGKPFALFRNIDGTFYADILRTIGHLFTS